MPASATPEMDPLSRPADLDLGTFSDTPPWLVEPDAMVWRRRVPVLRAMTRRSVPELTSPPTVPPVRRRQPAVSVSAMSMTPVSSSRNFTLFHVLPPSVVL